MAGISEPLDDPRLVRLVKQLFDYRGTRGVTVLVEKWRISILLDDLAYAKSPDRGADLLESSGPISKATLDALAATGAALSDVFGHEEAAVG